MHTPDCPELYVSPFSLAMVPIPIPIYHCPDWPEINENHCNVCVVEMRELHKLKLMSQNKGQRRIADNRQLLANGRQWVAKERKKGQFTLSSLSLSLSMSLAMWVVCAQCTLEWVNL